MHEFCVTVYKKAKANSKEAGKQKMTVLTVNLNCWKVRRDATRLLVRTDDKIQINLFLVNVPILNT